MGDAPTTKSEHSHGVHIPTQLRTPAQKPDHSSFFRSTPIITDVTILKIIKQNHILFYSNVFFYLLPLIPGRWQF